MEIEQKIQEIKARRDAAWPGPYHVEKTEYANVSGVIVHTDFEIMNPADGHLAEISCAHSVTDVEDPEAAVAGAEADATFFAAAWQDIGTLLELVDELLSRRPQG
ncbi:hypothetical protein AB0B15_17135 [Streptomyces sp. NPDC045456]|uniref:hypothetical protein n=1 Tax=Streptomyces sp. NPDC045456 TaxID=3155254 RepID=UPI0033E23F09